MLYTCYMVCCHKTMYRLNNTMAYGTNATARRMNPLLLVLSHRRIVWFEMATHCKSLTVSVMNVRSRLVEVVWGLGAKCGSGRDAVYARGKLWPSVV